MRILFGTLILAGSCLWASSPAHADTAYTLSCPESVIKGSIAYSVVGTYRSIFRECTGKIMYDDLHNQIKSVDITIKAASIKSNWPWCDKIARSRRGFNTALYPAITFKSTNIERKNNSWWISGIFDLHGVSKTLRSRFEFRKQGGLLTLKGAWVFNRKNFNMIWDKVLDHGGVMVGDYITVDCLVKAHKV